MSAPSTRRRRAAPLSPRGVQSNTTSPARAGFAEGRTTFALGEHATVARGATMSQTAISQVTDLGAKSSIVTTLRANQALQAAHVTGPVRAKAPKIEAVPRIETNLNGIYVYGDLVGGGLITAEEAAAFRSHHKAYRSSWESRKPVRGLADLRALRVAALLNYSYPMADRIYTDSLRYWWLVASHDLDWAGRRADKRLRKREQKAQALSEASRSLSNAMWELREYSKFHLGLARYCRDTKQAALIVANREGDQSARRRVVLAARSKFRLHLRKVLAAIAAYRSACEVA